MAKIERKYLAHFINTAQGNDNAVYERLGKDLEEFSPALSAQVERKRNILGETAIVISGYEKTSRVEQFYAEEGSALYTRLQRILDRGLVLDALKTDVVDVKLWELAGADNTYAAIREEAYIEVNSYGGDISGYQIPFTIHYTGKKDYGVFDVVNKTFTANE